MATRLITPDMRRARGQTGTGTNTTFEAVRGTLLATLGAVDAAARAATMAFNRARSEAIGRAEGAQTRLQRTLSDLQDRVSDLPNEVSELRRVAEQYGDLAKNVYTSLVERGEEVMDELRQRPRVQQALESVEAGVDTAQERLENAVRDLNAAVDELRFRFAQTSRAIGERAARETENAVMAAGELVQDTANKVSGAAIDAGDQVATTTRSTTRAVADQAAPSPRRPVDRRAGDNNTQRS